MKRFYFYRLTTLVAILLGCNWSSFAQTITYTYTGSIVSYTVPAGVTNISITASGAQGGISSGLSLAYPGGHGAIISGTIAVVPGHVLNILVGQQPAAATKFGGGGGGSFVWDAGATTIPLIAAGGGGGAGSVGGGIDASLTNNGTNGGGGITYGGGGTAGHGGTILTSPLLGLAYGAGGCGWLSNGANGSSGLVAISPLAQGGSTPLSGGAGGGYGGATPTAGSGGFGGGGGAEATPSSSTSANGGAGGGGGYSGGGGGTASVAADAPGGGGGSYCSGTLTSGSATNTGDGQVIITVLCGPGAITGNAALCEGYSEPLVDTTSGGTWSSVNTGIATVDASGNAYAVAPGTDTILYAVLSDCGTIDTVSATLTVNDPADAGTISGTPMVCEGTTTVLSDTLSGGTWSASNTDASVVGGTVTGVTAGTVTITYTNSCGLGTTSVVVTVNPNPSAGTITGTTNVCVGSSITLTDAATGGSWSASNTDASVIGGIVTGASAGTDIISYAVTGACGTNTATLTVTVTGLPSAGTISGPTSVCTSSSITLSDGVAGGTWSESNADASISASGATATLSGVSVGADAITYTVSNSCGVALEITAVSISAAPVAGSISGTTTTVCVGAAITLTDAATGGSWSAANTNASVAGGTVTGVTEGTDVITYSVTNSCGTATATQAITVNPMPDAGTISGPSPSAVCAGSFIVLTDAATGGAWSASSTAATVSGGTVTAGASAGVVTITYSVTNSCGTATATQAVTISTVATGGTITGTDSVCIGSTITLTDLTTGGVWSSSNTKATISAGVVTGVTAGLDTIAYTVTNICGSANATFAFKVKNCHTAEVNTIAAAPLNVYPNPANDELTIQMNNGAFSSFTITNSIGQVLMQQQITTSQTKINIKYLPSSAIYYITFRGQNGTAVQRFVKM